jgi:hypothetical protein
MALAMSASRSLIALLLATVVVFALWTFALKGNSSGGNSSKGPLGQYQGDINAAHKAVSTENASNAASGNENATSSGGAAASTGSPGSAKSSSSSASTSQSSAKAKSGSSARTTTVTHPKVTTVKTQRHSVAVTLSTVQTAVSSHKVVALLFYNPAAADDQAVRQELGSVPTHKGAVIKLAVPLSQAARFTAVTQQVPLNLSPTLVLIAKNDQASEIVGYTDSFEIDQRVDDALAAS